MSDLYAYSQCELNGKFTTEMQQLLNVIIKDSQLITMIDQQKLRQLINSKVNSRQNETQLVLLDNNKKINNKHRTNILQIQNNELNRQIQNNRSIAITKKNNFSYVSINQNSALNKFQSIVKEINLSTKINETNQQQKEDQENNI